MKKKNVILMSIAAVAIITAGCGSSGGGAATPDVQKANLLSAKTIPGTFNIIDSSTPPKYATETNGSYSFSSAPAYELYTSGPIFYDIDADGAASAGDIVLDTPFSTFGGSSTITALTSYLNEGYMTAAQMTALTGVSASDLTMSMSDAIKADNDELFAAISTALIAMTQDDPATYDFAAGYAGRLSNNAQYLPAPALDSDNTTSDNSTSDNSTSDSSSLTDSQVSDILANVLNEVISEMGVNKSKVLNTTDAASAFATAVAAATAKKQAAESSDNSTSDNSTSDNVTD